jgi:hypothetical protein
MRTPQSKATPVEASQRGIQYRRMVLQRIVPAPRRRAEARARTSRALTISAAGLSRRKHITRTEFLSDIQELSMIFGVAMPSDLSVDGGHGVPAIRLAHLIGDCGSVGAPFGHHGLVLAHRLIDVSGI